ncbi:MAG: phosphotransferase [Euryarchaeota archaeon]|nr:phosphotransferase [Euryarchaeota archaeon]
MRLSDADLREILRHYDLGKATQFEWLADGFQSDNYTLITDRGKYVVRIIYDTEPRVEYILGVYDFLASRNFPTARPVRTVNGRLYVVREGTPIAIQTFVEGIAAADDPGPLPVYGRELGRLHAALAEAPLAGPEDEACLPSLRRLAGRYPSPDPYVRSQCEALEGELSSLPLATYTRLVAHGDCGPKDFYFDGDRLTGVLDFGAAGPDYVLFDIATMMMYTRIFPRERAAEYASFIRAYLEAFSLPREELRGLHAFLKTRFLIQVFYHLMRYHEGITQGLTSREENLQGVEDGKAMLRLLDEVPRDFYLRVLESTA